MRTDLRMLLLAEAIDSAERELERERAHAQRRRCRYYAAHELAWFRAPIREK